MSWERWSYALAAVLLAVAGIAVSMYRQAYTGIPLLPDEARRVWQIEARVEFSASGEPAEVLLTLPPAQDGFLVLSESGASSGFGFIVDRAGPQRRAHWTKRSASGQQTLFYQMDLVEDPQHRITPEMPSEVSEAYFAGPYTTAASEVLNDFLPKSTGAKSLAEQLVQAINTDPLSQNMRLLRQGHEAAPLIAALLNRAGIAARTVKALQLEDGRRHQPLHDYVQVWHEDGWLLYDPERGRLDETADLLLWQTGTPSVIDVVGGSRSQVTFSMTSQTQSALTLSRLTTSPFDLSLHDLPIAEQGMFKLIMTLPVGALVVVFMRLVVGIRTSGTFMPVLIALTFVQTELLAGMIGLVVVVGAALLLRSYLSSLNLLLVARIATLVVVVIGLVLVLAVVSYRLGLISGLAITFFPMVILAWTVERMSILWEEEGAGEAMIQGTGSLVVAVCAYGMMSLEIVRHLAFNFPELNLLVLAGILLLGRYTGYRLTELVRFLPLAKRDSE
ncbi:MAG: UUP1 family membrane protein [Gammaproteobacteria bacterium]|nr:UUP1 family membrane protein [Gammaproteobacteria bacterium]MCY4324338.1 UUP1 family membrane protein [Gammaproteobacteria bacterium]